MPKKAPKKSKGRPPKHVIDENKREIVGLSYNKANNQYYLTYSNPREYLGSSKEIAIKRFNEKNAYFQMPPEAQIEQQYKNDIYSKALELLDSDPVIQSKLEDKAREEIGKIIIQQDYADRYYNSPTFKKILDKKLHSLIDVISSRMGHHINGQLHLCTKTLDKLNLLTRYTLLEYFGHGKNDDLNKDIKEIFYTRFREEAKTHFKENNYRLAWEVAYDLIINNPIDAAHKTGIKELAYLEMIKNEYDRHSPFAIDLPLPWWLAWKIYNHEVSQKRKPHYLRDEAVWNCIGAFIGINKSVDEVTSLEILEAIVYDYDSIETLKARYKTNEWNAISGKIVDRTAWFFPVDPKHRLSILKGIATVVYDCGYGQCMSLINLIEGLNKK